MCEAGNGAVAKEPFCFVLFTHVEHSDSFPVEEHGEGQLGVSCSGSVVIGAEIHLQKGFSADTSVVSGRRERNT